MHYVRKYQAETTWLYETAFRKLDEVFSSYIMVRRSTLWCTVNDDAAGCHICISNRLYDRGSAYSPVWSAESIYGSAKLVMVVLFVTRTDGFCIICNPIHVFHIVCEPLK